MVQRAVNYYQPDLVSAVEYQLDLDLDLVTQTVQEKRQAAVELCACMPSRCHGWSCQSWQC
jgi:hypothetical protein